MGILLEAVKLIHDKIDKDRHNMDIETNNTREEEINFKKIIDKERIDKIKSGNI